ncbi:hypothetical protein [Rhodococcus sp. 1168]|uniref:hypothetical protein n=1 Tax=Rhodococcus sp. 1168 TaxID=2018041 RepID=UPI000A0A88EF|nr:hypothetical protein [Rhodococcus sp. 1168]ORI28269.1 hypothetical protein BJI47_03165 [Rhodococcus sp. 1168]
MIWPWLEWTNAALSVPLALIGFVAAIWQAVLAKRAAIKAKDAAEAAQAAAEAAAKSAREQFKLLSTASIGPHLVRLEENIDSAIDKKSPELLTVAILNWRWQAGMCRQFLDPSKPQEKTLMSNIQKSIVAVKTLKLEILQFDNTTNWTTQTSRLRKAIGEVTADLGPLAAQQSVQELE